MKFYLLSVQYNKEAKAENRTVPKMFTELADAEAEFYTQVGKDMKTSTLGGSLNTVINSEGGQYAYLTKKWGFMSEDERPVEPEPEVEE